LFIKQILSVYM